MSKDLQAHDKESQLTPAVDDQHRCTQQLLVSCDLDPEEGGINRLQDVRDLSVTLIKI